MKTLLIAVQQEIVTRIKSVECSRLWYDSNTGLMQISDPEDPIKPSGVEVWQISRSWEDASFFLEDAKKDTVQWLWRARVSFPELIDPQPLLDLFEAQTFVPRDSINGITAYRISLTESVFQDPPFGGDLQGSQIDLTLDVSPLKK